MFVYKITNLKNKKSYVGQTTKKNPNDRWSAHKNYLKQNKCNNQYLQRAWNKYGSENFLFEVIDVAKTMEELNLLEIKYISQFGDYNILKGGLNSPKSLETRKKLSIANKGKSPPNKGKKTGPQSQELRYLKARIARPQGWPTLVSPLGKKFSGIVSLKSFAREHDLSDRHLRSVIQGKSVQHKGWHLETTSMSIIKNKLNNWWYNGSKPLITSPEGKIFKVENLTKFCKEHELHTGSISRVLNKKILAYKGWKL